VLLDSLTYPLEDPTSSTTVTAGILRPPSATVSR